MSVSSQHCSVASNCFKHDHLHRVMFLLYLDAFFPPHTSSGNLSSKLGRQPGRKSIKEGRQKGGKKKILPQCHIIIYIFCVCQTCKIHGKIGWWNFDCHLAHFLYLLKTFSCFTVFPEYQKHLAPLPRRFDLQKKE